MEYIPLLAVGYCIYTFNERLNRLEQQVIKQQVINDFKQKRKDAGYPCRETYDVVYTGRPLNTWIIKKYFTLGYRNIKGIYLKNKYPGIINLVVGGQVVQPPLYNMSRDGNLLDTIGGKLLLGLNKFHEAWLFDSLGILMQDDIIIEYHNEVENETFKKIHDFNGKYIQYFTDIYGVRQKIIYSHGMMGSDICRIPQTPEQRQQRRLIKKDNKAVRRRNFINRMINLNKTLPLYIMFVDKMVKQGKLQWRYLTYSRLEKSLQDYSISEVKEVIW